MRGASAEPGLTEQWRSSRVQRSRTRRQEQRDRKQRAPRALMRAARVSASPCARQWQAASPRIRTISRRQPGSDNHCGGWYHGGARRVHRTVRHRIFIVSWLIRSCAWSGVEVKSPDDGEGCGTWELARVKAMAVAVEVYFFHYREIFLSFTYHTSRSFASLLWLIAGREIVT